jgi:hypothetical protein
MGQRARPDNSQKPGLIDHASIGFNDDPIISEECIECIRVIAGHRSRKFVLQFQQFFFHRICEK